MEKEEIAEAIKCYINDVLQSPEVIKYYCQDVDMMREMFRNTMLEFKEEK